MLKKSPQKYLCGVLLFLNKIKEKAKGEEKPEEELMGKRKSSPRLATTSIDAVAILSPGAFLPIHMNLHFGCLCQKTLYDKIGMIFFEF
jgi:hypothetical protein